MNNTWQLMQRTILWSLNFLTMCNIIKIQLLFVSNDYVFIFKYFNLFCFSVNVLFSLNGLTK